MQSDLHNRSAHQDPLLFVLILNDRIDYLSSEGKAKSIPTFLLSFLLIEFPHHVIRPLCFTSEKEQV